MDVALQVHKHLPRDPEPTITIVDDYCTLYQDLFQDVRSYECFKYLHLGIISPIPRKSLPEIAKVVGINSAQSLHHFFANSPWSLEELRKRRLKLIKEYLGEEPITVIIDETGDRKKGKKKVWLKFNHDQTTNYFGNNNCYFFFSNEPKHFIKKEVFSSFLFFFGKTELFLD